MRLTALALAFILPLPVSAADAVLFNCTVHTAAGDPIPNAVIVVTGGKIARVADNATKVVDLPADGLPPTDGNFS